MSRYEGLWFRQTKHHSPIEQAQWASGNPLYTYALSKNVTPESLCLAAGLDRVIPPDQKPDYEEYGPLARVMGDMPPLTLIDLFQRWSEQEPRSLDMHAGMQAWLSQNPVRLAMQQQDLTPSSLSRLAQISRRTVERALTWSEARKQPSTPTFLAMGRALDRSGAELIEDYEDWLGGRPLDQKEARQWIKLASGERKVWE